MALQRPANQRRRCHVVLVGRFAVLPVIVALGCGLLPGKASASLPTVPARFVPQRTLSDPLWLSRS